MGTIEERPVRVGDILVRSDDPEDKIKILDIINRPQSFMVSLVCENIYPNGEDEHIILDFDNLYEPYEEWDLVPDANKIKKEKLSNINKDEDCMTASQLSRAINQLDEIIKFRTDYEDDVEALVLTLILLKKEYAKVN